ncbi:MAG TPA: molybdopterin molybdotransferase MoeA, partial [Chitinophagaceae bacterium]|nr:molybdopterin molybdotransferase MoeA [Chitinophagaceae bacterium]
MISVAEAKKIIKENTEALPPKKIMLQQAEGLVLAEDVFALTTVPGFPQSSMDGYALSFKDLQVNRKLKISGVIAAGSSHKGSLLPGNAVRIFTGAAVPPGADTVVMQEKTKVENGELIVEDDKLKKGMHVRPEGAEIKTGELALVENSLLTPAAIGFLTAVGITEVMAYTHPVISIIITGDELQEPGKPLQYGQVYEANSFTLKAALQYLRINDVKILFAKDNLAILAAVLTDALATSDV